MKKPVVIIIAVLAIIVAVFVFTSQSAKSPEQSASNTDATADINTETTQENTITYSDNGFEPANITVKSGASISIKNSSSRVLQFNSDEHPSHTNNSEYNVGAVSPGKSKSFTVNKTGIHGYHDHLKAQFEGTVIVE